jgi:hypothetical protein
MNAQAITLPALSRDRSLSAASCMIIAWLITDHVAIRTATIKAPSELCVSAGV